MGLGPVLHRRAAHGPGTKEGPFHERPPEAGGSSGLFRRAEVKENLGSLGRWGAGRSPTAPAPWAESRGPLSRSVESFSHHMSVPGCTAAQEPGVVPLHGGDAADNSRR